MNKHYNKRFVRYMRRTYKNKIVAIALLTIGWLSTLIDNDGTFLLLAVMFGVPLLFTNKNWIYY